ncbi:hypothetical protein HPB51_012199 [Rhipicephalus microplus]|uniref:Uncharacterized protein n=1 Tax=Rhipicephalus microplus TaxID=6941 RepID=A0A9J6E8G5_RHIMP|nr:hypothetical protein HPB51_012199 [Rhipicephalus microplus]
MLSDLLQQPDLDTSQITSHMDFLKDNKAELSRLDEVILATTDGEILDHEVGTAQEYKKILYVVSRAKFWLQEREKMVSTQAQATEPGPSYLASSNSADAAGQTYLRCGVLLPSGAIKCLHEPQTSTTIYLYGSKVSGSQERSATSLTTRLLAARPWKTRSRRTNTPMLVNAVCVDVVSDSVSMVTPYLNNSSQTSHLLGNHDDRHRIFIILHAQHVSLMHLKNMHPPSHQHRFRRQQGVRQPRIDGRSAQALPVAKQVHFNTIGVLGEYNSPWPPWDDVE